MVKLSPERNALWKSLDEIQNVGFSTNVLKLSLSHVRMWLHRTEKNVEANGSCVKCRLLGDKSEALAIALHIDITNGLSIQLDHKQKDEIWFKSNVKCH